MATVNQEFSNAPLSLRARFFGFAWIIVSAVGLVVVPLTGLAHFIRSREPLSALGLVSLVALMSTVAAMIIRTSRFLGERTEAARIKIEENYLVLGKNRYLLEGLVEAVRGSDWGIVLGNGNLGAVPGCFWSTRVGKFEGFLTDPNHAVILRWPDQKVVVSPADPEFFINCAKSAAGLR